MEDSEVAEEMHQFIENSRPYHLTLGDVKKFPIGYKFEVVNWDRNYEEYWIWDNAIPLAEYDPEIFFKENKLTLTYKGNMRWVRKDSNGETYDEETIEIDVSNLQTYWKWVPLSEDGYVDITTEELREGQKIPKEWKPKHIHWSRLPNNTRVGIRGPMMYWDYLKDLPLVYYEPFRK